MFRKVLITTPLSKFVYHYLKAHKKECEGNHHFRIVSLGEKLYPGGLNWRRLETVVCTFQPKVFALATTSNN